MTTKKKTPGKAKPKKAVKKPAKKTVDKKPGKKSARKPVKKAPVKAAKKTPPLHWLVRPETIRKLWIGGGVMLAALVAIEAKVQIYGTFGLDGTFAFYAWYGFAACVAMVVTAKGLGFILKREDTYYGGD